MSTCKRCGNQIVWFKDAGSWVAVNAESVEPGDKQIGEHHVNHFADCKQQSKRGYTKPEVVISRNVASQYVRDIPTDEWERMQAAINRGRQ